MQDLEGKCEHHEVEALLPLLSVLLLTSLVRVVFSVSCSRIAWEARSRT